MKFGRVPLDEAEGAVLAHSLKVGTGRIAKGTILQAAEIYALRAAGIPDVVVARLEVDDIEENAAAATLAQALVPSPEHQGLRIANAGAGRVNLFAQSPGVAIVDAQAILATNLVDPMITVATLAPFTRVDAGTMVATIKIIAYAVSHSSLSRAQDAARSALEIAKPVFRTATLIETQVGSETPADKGRRVTSERLDRFGMSLTDRVVVDHENTAIAQAIKDAPGDVVLILTASATSDVMDEAPEGLRLAGGRVEAYGMPVDPGNLLFFGTAENRPVIGLPGCARSPAMNGVDWVLERLICGVKLTQADIQAMGVGGLLKEIPTRPRPRASKG
ncbi:MAG: molybdopterin-binding protein [Paracoccaceae bacterium]